jgi:hypothetical protein
MYRGKVSQSVFKKIFTLSLVEAVGMTTIVIPSERSDEESSSRLFA